MTQRDDEIEAGRRASERAARLDLFERTCREPTNRVRYMVAVHGHRYWKTGEYNIIVYADGQEVWHGDKSDREFPPPELMAVLGLTAQALDLTIPPPDPTHKVSEEGRRYKERLREVNAHRWGDQ